jgi:hypothetical protein
MEVPSTKTKLVELKWPTLSPEEAMTPTNSQKWYSISSVATVKNLHINTSITEYTSFKRVNTTLEFLLYKKCKGIALKMLVTLSPFASRNGRCQANPTTPTKGKERKNRKEECGRGLYKHGCGRKPVSAQHPWVRADARPHPRGRPRAGADARRRLRVGADALEGEFGI